MNKQTRLLYSIWLFTYRDFQGIYVCVAADAKIAYFEAVLTATECDTEINLDITRLDEFGKCVWQIQDIITT